MRTEEDMIADGWLKVGSPEYSAKLRDWMIESLKDMTGDDRMILGSYFCYSCGDLQDPTEMRCQCWNDE